VFVVTTPEWLAGNVAPIAIGVLVVLSVLVIRLVTHTVVRLVLVVLIAGVGVFVYVNRAELERCAETCECKIREREVDVPACDPDLDPSRS
jgi:hypothetical protein